MFSELMLQKARLELVWLEHDPARSQALPGKSVP